MTRPTFSPSPAPSISGLSTQTKARVLKAAFGDGYTQRGGDGLNTLPATVSATWPPMLRPELDAIEGFLAARRGFESFNWTVPGESASRIWTCETWSVSAAGSTDLFVLSATFEQVFDI
jgi:phage-related protein